MRRGGVSWLEAVLVDAEERGHRSPGVNGRRRPFRLECRPRRGAGE